MARKWEAIICYEDRAEVHTSRWRLDGVATKEAAENTDSGVLWLELSLSVNTLTANLYKDDGLEAANKVATGTADISAVDGTAANAAELALSCGSDGSGLSGSFWVHQYVSAPADAPPVQVALCTDEDLDGLWDGIEALPGYDATLGCAEFIRIATEDVLGKVAAIYKHELEGHASPEAWYIVDASRLYPDLRRIANPGQLRIACAHHALEIAVGRSHQMATNTMYSSQRDYHAQEYERAMAALTLTFKSGSGDNAEESASAQVIQQERV